MGLNLNYSFESGTFGAALKNNVLGIVSQRVRFLWLS